MNNLMLERNTGRTTREVPCPGCGFRLCDVSKRTRVAIAADMLGDGTVYVKCHKCHRVAALFLK